MTNSVAVSIYIYAYCIWIYIICMYIYIYSICIHHIFSCIFPCAAPLSTILQSRICSPFGEMPQVHQKKMATCCRCQIRYHRGSKPWFLCKDPLNSRVDPRPQKKGDQNWTVDAAGKILQLKKSQRLVEIYPVKNPLVIYIYVLDLLHELAKSQHFLAAWHQLACTLQAAAVHVVFFFSR